MSNEQIFFETEVDGYSIKYTTTEVDGQLSKVESRSMTASRISEDAFSIQFKFLTVSKKKTIALGWCEIDEIVKLHKMWMEVEPDWQDKTKIFGRFEKV